MSESDIKKYNTKHFSFLSKWRINFVINNSSWSIVLAESNVGKLLNVPDS